MTTKQIIHIASERTMIAWDHPSKQYRQVELKVQHLENSSRESRFNHSFKALSKLFRILKIKDIDLSLVALIILTISKSVLILCKITQSKVTYEFNIKKYRFV